MNPNQMMTFAQLKLEMRNDSPPDSKYERFLNELRRHEFDKLGKDASWDIWYFSDNTGFCIRSAGRYLTELNELRRENKKMKQLQLDVKKVIRPSFSHDKYRRAFGNFCLYLYAALGSFYHETNILYELGIERRYVTFNKIKEKLGNFSLFRPHEGF